MASLVTLLASWSLVLPIFATQHALGRDILWLFSLPHSVAAKRTNGPVELGFQGNSKLLFDRYLQPSPS